MSSLSYNERSWAVDVISAVNQLASVKKLEIRRAGGEHTLKQKGQNSLFPDVLLFGDESGTRVRHGWEMKFPDTKANDPDTVENAIEKAERLQVNSFIIWNVDRAHLHVKDDQGEFPVVKMWGPIGATKRSDVGGLDAEWRTMLGEIFDDLNAFFASGQLKSAPPSFLEDRFFTDFLIQHEGVTAEALKGAADKDATVEAQFSVWWATNAENAGTGKQGAVDYKVLAQIVIVGWINRLLFCHYLKGFRKEASDVEKIAGEMSVEEGLDVLKGISDQCDFMQIFQPDAGTTAIPDETWGALKELNAFMADLSSGSVSQEALRLALEGALSATRRKSKGQFTTPDRLAELLVAVGVTDRTGVFLDPCCGTGTIPKAALLSRVSRGQSHAEALEKIWASDRFQFPLQFTTIALAEPEAIGVPLRVFRADVFTLEKGRRIELADPHDGSMFEVELPPVSTIGSNLPFVRFETLAQHDPGLVERFSNQVEDADLDGRSDLFGYIVLFLRTLLVDQGRISVIVSNSWLGTEWGSALRKRLAKDFHVDAVITSGSGKWFDNADVVTNILVLQLKAEADKTLSTRFVTTLKPIEEWNNAYVAEIATSLHSRAKTSEVAGSHKLRDYSANEIEKIESQIIGWPGLFADVSWITNLTSALIPVRSLINIARGERRGWDPLFYPAKGHGIEPRYIKPVLLNTRDVSGLTASASGDAFCCSLSVDELQNRGDTGALKWIRKFENEVNGTNKPLTDVLATSGRLWYEMTTESTADFAIGMNPEDRIFTARLDKRSFVNQRLIRLSADNGVDLELIHALLNSSLSIFFIESSGFGRGLGALDITPTKLKAGMKIVNPAKISKQGRDEIVAAFTPLLKRDVLKLDQEVSRQDRIDFDRAVLGSVGMEAFADDVRNAVVELYRIRKSVKI